MPTPRTLNRIASLAMISAVLLAVGCGGGLEYRHEQNERGGFARYQKLSFMRATDVGNFTRGRLDDEQRAVVRAEARSIFDRKGWTIVEESSEADLILVAGVGRRIRVEERFEGPPTLRFETYEQEIKEGTIVVDAWDRRTRQHVWHGRVVGETGETPVSAERLVEVIQLLLSEFPVAGSGY